VTTERTTGLMSLIPKPAIGQNFSQLHSLTIVTASRSKTVRNVILPYPSRHSSRTFSKFHHVSDFGHTRIRSYSSILHNCKAV